MGKTCPQCGAQLPEAAAVRAARTSAAAVISLILGIFAIVPFIGFFSGIAAIFLGIAALREINRRQDRLTGKGWAKAGIIVASVLIILHLMAAIPSFLDAQLRSKVAVVKSDIVLLAKTLESYAADNSAYPPITSLPQPGNKWQGTAELSRLTTPFAYITQLPKDPFSLNKEQFYVFVNLKPGLSPIPEEKCRPLFEQFGAWVLAGAGPDEDLDLDLLSIADDRSGATFCNTVYDPTNGNISGGDILISRKVFD